MRVYQLTNFIANFSEIRCFKILYEYLSNPMSEDAFITYFKVFNERNKITQINITTDYLNKLNIGKNMLAPGWNINVSDITKKIRLYSYDNCNDLFPTEFNINELHQFKSKITAEYNNIVTTSTNELTLSLDELTTDEYLNGLAVGDNTVFYKYKYKDGTVSQDSAWFTIRVREYVI